MGGCVVRSGEEGGNYFGIGLGVGSYIVCFHVVV